MDTHPDPDLQYLETDPDPPSDANPRIRIHSTHGFLVKYRHLLVYSCTDKVKD
jgi:hypothetical protein